MSKPTPLYNRPQPDLYLGSIQTGPYTIAVGAAMLRFIFSMWYEPGYGRFDIYEMRN